MIITLYQYLGEEIEINKHVETLTKQITLNGELRDSVDVMNPVIDIEATPAMLLQQYNYAYFNGRAYWIYNITFFRKNIWRLELREDLYFTWKNIILNTEGIISRAEDGIPSRLKDEKVLCSSEPIIDFQYGTEPFTANKSDNITQLCYILTIATHPQKYGSVTVSSDFQVTKNSAGAVYSRSYILNYNALAEFVDKCWGSGNKIEEYFKSFFTDFAEGVINIVMYPFKVNSVIESYSDSGSVIDTNGVIMVGDTTLTLDNKSVRLIKDLKYLDIYTCHLTIKERYGSFLDYSPYTEIKLFLPFIGFVDLDADLVMGKTLDIYYRLDYITTNAMVEIRVADGEDHGQFGTGRTIYVFDTTVGTSISMSRTNITDRRNQMLQAGIKAAGGIFGAKQAYNIDVSKATMPGSDIDSMFNLGNKTKANAANVATNFAIDMIRANRVHISGGQSSNEYMWNFINQGLFAMITRPNVIDSMYELDTASNLYIPNNKYKHLYGIPVMEFGTVNDTEHYGYIELSEYHLKSGKSNITDAAPMITKQELNALDNLLANGGFINSRD